MAGSSGESVLSRVVRIIESFGSEAPALRVSEIARRADLHIATASRLVEELVGYGWLQRDDDRRVRIGVRMWELASRASPTLSLREAAMPFMEDLHAVVGHHVQLGVRESDEVLFVERLSAPGAVINLTRIAGRLSLHVSSSGIVLLAHAPSSVQEKVLAGPLRAYTAHTVVDPKQLRALLADVRKSGVAVCRGFVDPRATGVAVPLRGPDNTVVAALSTIVPNDDNARMHIPALQAAARGVSRAMGVQDLCGRTQYFSH
ncbi:IclR family transcriptional regulator [Haloactinomyces albus]|uniref:DNA-binding IclR family transcriptional regulator n=1 Tax=Haloactinomyces albus TaxID=1352928 RepID=A0AAE3ZHJ9_9ACTN|nr:IclR family transcriptional regulator [Haloactinomyces albus]MDR7304051.1 DNA-binding IclR family transcriptional regulator [Haloactinomyces albus]